MTDHGGLAVIGASKRFGSLPVVKDVDVLIERGRVTALMGENGAGKSTLLKMLAGVHRADTGTFVLDGEPVEISSVPEAQQLGIAIVHQELNLTENQTVAQNILLGREHTYGPKWMGFIDTRKVRAHAQSVLSRVGSAVSPDATLGDLSPAQQQQVEIAKALSQPDISILLLDEPTSSLPEEQAKELLALLRGLSASGLGVVITTHRLDEAFAVADRFVVMRDGDKVGEFEASDPATTRDRIVTAMVGRELSTLFPRERRPSDHLALEVSNLSRGMVRDVSFSIRAGEVFGLGGLVGAGRTEVARCIVGADRKSAGAVRLFGEEVRIRSPRDAVSLGIGFVPEDRKGQGLVQSQDIERNIALPNLSTWQRAGLIAFSALRRAVEQGIETLRIKARGPRQLVSQLSGGNQQKVVLAKWLARDLRLLILDEPTRGVDVGARADIYRQIDEIAAAGVAVLLISSDMEELIGLSDRVGVMAEGSYMGTLSQEEISQEAIMRLASRLDSLSTDASNAGGEH